jgi:hypothetical protein
MRRRNRYGWSLVCLVVLASQASAALFDHSSYDAVLRHYVDDEGGVNYASVRDNSLSALESYFERLGDADLAGWPYPERLAFWINAYNARVLYLVAQKPNMKKISSDFELLNQPFKVAGVMLSANDIEHRILRGTTNPDNKKGPIPGLTLDKRDPRVLFSLVCGAVDSPPLHNFAYTAENVDDTLYSNAKHVANSSKYVDIVDGRLKLSSLFKWYAKDFDSAGGVAAYLKDQITAEKRGDADTIQGLLIADFKNAEYGFDWTVNDQKNLTPQDAPLTPAPPADPIN